jgi:hypothetical protein
MRKWALRVGSVFTAGGLALSLMASPALADSESCRGECTTRPVFANGHGHYIDVRVRLADVAGSIWCSWTLRDFDNNALVASGKVYDGESSRRVGNLRNRYKLFVSNYNCWGTISNN